MAFIPVPNTAEVILQGSINAHDAFITLNFEQADPFTIGDLEALLTAVEDWWDNHLTDELCSAYLLPSIKAVALQTDSAPTVTDTAFTHHSGQQAVAPVQDNVAMVVSHYTDNRGRSFRGRNYIPALPAGYLDTSSTFAETHVDDMTAVYEALQTIMNDTPFTHVVVSRYTGGAPRLLGLTTPVVRYQAKRSIGTQRRRVTGYGS